MEFLKALLRPRAARHRREAAAFLARVREMPDRDVGLLVAIAAHQRNALVQQGHDLGDLERFRRQRPKYPDELARAVVQLNARGQHHDAFGLLVWLHTLRALASGELTDLGTALWSELRRGFPHVAAQRETFREETGFELDISHATEIPARLDAER